VTDKCHIDIETYSEEPLKKSGVYRYAENPSTEVMVLCYRFGHDGPVHTWIPLEEIPRDARPLKKNLDKGSQLYIQKDIPEDLAEWIMMGGELRAWNAMFERVVLGTLGADGRLDWPEVPREQWFCTMAKAAAHSLRQALGDCAKDTGRHPKDETGKMTMLQLCKPRKPSKNDPDERWAIDTHPDKYRVLYHYCMDDVRAESDLDNYIPELSPGEKRAYHLDQKINDAGIAVDLDNVRSAQVLVEEYKKRLVEQCQEIAGVRPSQTAALADWIRDDCFYSIENLQAATVKEALKDPDIPEDVAKVLKIYSTYNMKAVSKFPAMEKAVCKDGRLRGMFRYHSASTGRWSSVIVQLQNLFRSVIGDEECAGEYESFAIEAMQFEDLDYFRGLFDKNPMKVLASCVRGMLVAAFGKKLLAIDYAAIEARVVAWLAGQLDILKVFETDGRIYEYTAMKIFGLKSVEEVTKAQRFIGKIAVLALGYQGGKKAFASMAKQYGVDFPEDEAEQVKLDWREANPKIVKLWYDLEEAASAAIANPGSIYQVAGDRIMFKVEGDWLYMRLPSGRRLAYYRPKLDGQGKPTYMGIDTYTRRWMRCKTYGGKLCENAVQAIARDLLLNSMLHLDADDFDIIGTVHDEAIMEIDAADEKATYQQVERLMCWLPKWAEGLPVGVDGFVERRYRK
jgi:DNA polymerase